MAALARFRFLYFLQRMYIPYSGRPKHCGWPQQYQSPCYMATLSASATLAKGSEKEDKAILEELEVPFSKTAVGTFFQDHPKLGNQYLEDVFLQGYLKRHLPPKMFEEVNQQLERFGARVVDEIDYLGRECELSLPQLQQYDAWGQRVDRIITCPAWKRMKEISAEEGLIAEAYERKYSSWSRVYQVSKMYLYAPSSGLFTCPLAMTDGAAKVIENLCLFKSLDISGPLAEAYSHLTSRDPKQFWTSGQWMTERKGGSDVAAGTETIAREQPDGTYRLYGFKWFTSATDSDMTLTLGRAMDTKGNTKQGTKGLSLFYLKIQSEEGKLNGIEVQRLKEKLGTRQVPTAELLLDGAKAFRISDEGHGVSAIANMLTITRIHNTIFAVAIMRRMINLAREYANQRFAFGKFIKDHPLHIQTMARMEVQTRGAFLLLMEVAKLLGLEETNMATKQDQHILRLMTPVAKLYTGKQAISTLSEGLECFGGQGYMEDTGLPAMLRDAQVLTIWEGTTNILSLDVLRAVAKSEGQVLVSFFAAVQSNLDSSVNIPELAYSVTLAQAALNRLGEFTQRAGLKGSGFLELAARDFAYSLARIYIGGLLLKHAAWTKASPADIYSAQRWCEQDLCPVDTVDRTGSYKAETAFMNTTLVYEGSPLLKGKLNMSDVS
uniref:Acyl-CoA dehydrogenase family member 11-like isoform X2 n=1 Tax=Geotrypetes seraphini TaxID=260995 RepID=A0A6P8RYW5_GEOSA|nr:acyl-CoA dehydrogenase family member 11-like isoform X2 [Geotrypetes seraphini]